MIFNKIFKGFIVILVLSFTVLGGFLFPLLSNYVISEKENMLMNAGARISEMSSGLALKEYSEYKDLYQLSIDIIGQNLNSEVILADKNGHIIIKTTYRHTEHMIEKIPQDILKEINSGKNARKLGKFFDYKDSTLTIGVPVFYGMLIGTVFGLLIIPLFYILVQTLYEKWKKE